jgi:anti-sigma factor RsiW
MSCRQISALLDTFRDGELPADQTLEVEHHVSECESCREHLRFGNALRTSLRRAVQADAQLSPGFESRLTSALRSERERILSAESAPVTLRPATNSTRAAVLPLALAAAASFAFVAWGSHKLGQRTPRLGEDAPLSSAPSHAAIIETPEQVLDELVNYHAAPPAPQITEATLVPKFEPEVGVPVRLPALMKQYGASWEGGSVVPMKNQRAAIFRYKLSNHPVTVYVYDARRVPLRGVLEPRVVHNQAVSVGERRGYSIAAREQRGVGYAVATDLNDEESAELITTMY